MMKIAYICTDLGVPVFGCKGCSIHVQEVIRAFINQGADVTLFTPRPGGATPLDLQGVTLIQLPRRTSMDARHREIFALDLNEKTAEEIAQAGPFDMIYERYSLWGYSAMEFAKSQNIPGILEVNAPLIEEQSRHRELFNLAEAEQTTRRAFAAASALAAVSNEVASYLDGYHEAHGRVHVISNGVNLSRFKSSSVPESGEVFTIGFVGTLKPWHGLDNLIEAFVLLHRNQPSARLLIVGDGPKRDHLESALKSYGLADAAHFTGAVVPDQVPKLLAKMDVAVAPYPESQAFYFSPLKVLEYMAAGLPVVASCIGQITSLIQHDYDGILCPPGEPTALAQALEQLMLSPVLCQALGREARRTVEQSHGWHSVTQRIFKLANVTNNMRPTQQAHQVDLNGTL